MSETYIKLFRKAIDNNLFSEKPFDRWHAFEWLLLRACRFDKTEVIKGQVVNLKQGQLIIGQRSLAETFGWSRGKLDRFCKLLEDLKMASFDRATYGASIGTLITIENYSKYQSDQATGSTTDRATNRATGSTTDRANIKKEKKDKEYISPPMGEFKNVLITEEELEKLKERFPYDWKDKINNLSAYIDSKGKRYKSHYATILVWAKKDKQNSPPEIKAKKYAQYEPEEKEIEKISDEEQEQRIKAMRERIGGLF